jgi:hypothetical protein
MIIFARNIDDQARKLRARQEQEVNGPVTRAQERISRARFRIFGDGVYPDATFSPRLSYGSVQGLTEPSGRIVQPFTYFDGLFRRATGAPPYALSQRWKDAQMKLDRTTIFNVATNNDIIGGNSGSPLLDRNGCVVGVVFDINIHALGGDYAFDPRLNRAVSLTSAAIEEVLVQVYGMQKIVDEIMR